VPTLVIGEKPDVAKRLALILSSNSYSTKKVGKLSYHQFKFQQEDYYSVGLRGHILSLDYPKQYKRWNKNKLRELANQDPEMVSRVYDIVNLLEQLAPKVDKVIIATDYDREGELIGTEALSIVRKANTSLTDDDIFRAKFSALSAPEVKSAFKNLTRVDTDLADAAEVRQVVDLAWGAVLTRFFSLTAGTRGKNYLSIGRVQSPTLVLITEREKEILDFKPEKYWKIKAELGNGQPFVAWHERDRIFDSKVAELFYRRVKDATKGQVENIENKDTNHYPPPPFNTTSFINEATRIGMTASRIMVVAEQLYMKGYISYPRTDNTVYPKMNYTGQVTKFQGSEFDADAKKLLQQQKLSPSRGKVKATDHPPIYPTAVISKSDLSSNEEWRVYEMVCRRFFATLSTVCVISRTKVDISIKDEIFKAEGSRLKEEGWRFHYGYSFRRPVPLPALKKGQKVKVNEVEKVESETSPPPRYTEGGLITLMDKLGLGTKSTRHEILKKLKDRDYIEVIKNLQPTELGMGVAEALIDFATHISEPEMTSQLEEEMTKVAEGQMTKKGAISDSRKMLLKVLDEVEVKKDEIGTRLKLALKESNGLGKCPKCGESLVIRTARKTGRQFAGCSSYPKCDQTYPLPPGKIVKTDQVCSKCNTPQIKVINGKKKKPWVTCLSIDCKQVTP
jgi:DNA topoisomerase-1